MDKETVKEYLENSANIDGDELPLRFFERLIMHGLRVDLIEIGRVICTFKVPPRLLNGSNYLHGGATATLVDLVGSAAVYTVGAPFTGVSVEINVTFMDAAYADELKKIPLELPFFVHLVISWRYPFFLASCK
ncbi:acyl-coenzyme A thioesterase 13-like isoform X4 [Herrania umbratica]|uniref:Acyl-coenzyme A thioesterase 13-like isoform X4 n=1 Tax=Herrania umbratica TaxID=108875 RepID=A0A6J0ZIQ2_9ROSI|nr:acyl-coenzyme A thioesterase 13-like isoform X4 [Herrania umbratica]